MRKRLPIILILTVIVAAAGLGVWVLVQNGPVAIDEPTATVYATSIPVATVKPTDTTVSPAPLPTAVPTLFPSPTPLPSLRFHLSAHTSVRQQYRFVSLNESDIITLYGLNLSDYRFPEDYPFTIRDGVVYLKVQVNSETYYLKTGFDQEMMLNLCSPSDDASKLLCTVHSNGSGDLEDDLGISDDDVDSLLEQMNSKEMEGVAFRQVYDALYYKRHFIFVKGLRDIYVLPGEGRDGAVSHYYRTHCHWLNNTKIECVTGGGTSFDTTLFDLSTEMYTDLPGCCGNNLDVFESFYLQPQSLWRYNLYNLDSGSFLHSFMSFVTPIATEEAIAFIEPCEGNFGDFSGPLCFHYLEIDERDITREVKLDLSAYALEGCQWVIREEKTIKVASMFLHRTPNMYLATACDRAFFIPLDDLEIAEVVGLSSDEYGAAAYRYENFVVTQRVSGGSWPNYSYQTTVFDLDQCEGVLDETCVSKTWAGSVVHSEAVKGWGERFYSSPPYSPALLIVSGGGSLTICDLDTQREAVLDGRLVGVSEDGTKVLFSKDEIYRLFDLEDWRIIDVEAAPGQGLILARDWI